MKGRLITDNMHNFCNLINAANILESPSTAVATDVQFASRAGPGRGSRAGLCPGVLARWHQRWEQGTNLCQNPARTLFRIAASRSQMFQLGRVMLQAGRGGSGPDAGSKSVKVGISVLPPCPACAAAKGRSGMCNQGKFSPKRDQKSLWDGSHSSNPIHPHLELKPSKSALL